MIHVISFASLPMALFWFLAAAMAALAVMFVVVPMLRGRAPGGPSEVEANLEILRGQRREIEADIALGSLPADSRDEALAELVGRAATDLSGPRDAPAVEARKPWRTAAVAALAMPALAFGLYLAIGSPGVLDPAAATAAGKTDDKQILAMVESLAAKVKERPDDAKGWALLARSFGALGRYQEASDAYAHLLKLTPPDAQVLADYADALAMAQGRRLAGRPEALIRQALEIDPRHPKALALAASAAADAGDLAASLGHWQTLADTLPADSEDAREVGVIMAELRQQAKGAGMTLPPPKAAAAPATVAMAPQPAVAKAAGSKPAQSVSGSVALSPDLGAKLSGAETVFILARAEGGPRTPLAVIRAVARELPMKFALDDSQAMSPGVNISSASAVRIEARVSLSGNVMAQKGDLVGTSAPVKPGARDVKIVVDRVVP
jgi:cytochrome c-type biogenesis protein CcmH